MIKPKKLKPGDVVAIVSLSSGMGGDEKFIHKYELGKKRLEEDFGLQVITMPNALKGSEYLKNHPEKRAEDLIDAFKNTDVKAIISMIGGDDTIRLLPYIDYEIIKNNPKIFIGYSDTTINHLMMYKSGLISFYGPSILSEFAENGKMHDYTISYIRKMLFNNEPNIVIKSSDKWTNDRLDWTNKENDNKFRKMNIESHHYEVIQGTNKFKGQLLGGCVEVLQMAIGTDIWPDLDEWKNKVLYLETSEDKPSPSYLKCFLRNLVAQGIIDNISGIIVGKPKGEVYYEEYKEVLKSVIGIEAKRSNLPILYNVNFGHTAPMCIIPNGGQVSVNLDNYEIKLVGKNLED